MTRFIYNTATSLNGFIADEDNSLEWLFAVEAPDPATQEQFMARVGVLIEGSTTYEWVLREENLLEHPEKWAEFYGSRPTFVFTSRQLAVPEGADVRFINGPVSGALPSIIETAGGLDAWIVGGGELAGQFFDADSLDEIQLSVSPVALSGGASLLPRRIGSERLRLDGVTKVGQFAQLNYTVRKGTALKA